MLTGSDILFYLACKYNANWDDIFDGVKRKEPVNEDEVNAFKARTKSKWVTILQDDYPEILKEVHKPPFVLFYYGDISLLKDYKKILGVVGSRDSQIYSQNHCRRIVQEIGDRMIICSGMANGIDACAHHACIDANGKTIAVLGCGIDYIYPKSNKDLYEIIKKDHLLISEFPFDLAPTPESFPIRNRIITGLSWGLFVPEVKRKSGTLISIAHALNQNKEIYILPQPVKNNTYNNRIIRDGAYLAESAEDILE